MLGVSGATYGNLTPAATSPRRQRESASPGGDVFAPSSEAPAGTYSRPRLPAQRASQTPRLAAWAAKAGMLLSGLGALAFPPDNK